MPKACSIIGTIVSSRCVAHQQSAAEPPVRLRKPTMRALDHEDRHHARGLARSVRRIANVGILSVTRHHHRRHPVNGCPRHRSRQDQNHHAFFDLRGPLNQMRFTLDQSRTGLLSELMRQPRRNLWRALLSAQAQAPGVVPGKRRRTPLGRPDRFTSEGTVKLVNGPK